jgi:hypothetical protein
MQLWYPTEQICVDDSTLDPNNATLVPRAILVSDSVIVGYDSPTWQLLCPVCNVGAFRHNFDGAISIHERAILMSDRVI